MQDRSLVLGHDLAFLEKSTACRRRWEGKYESRAAGTRARLRNPRGLLLVDVSGRQWASRDIKKAEKQNNRPLFHSFMAVGGWPRKTSWRERQVSQPRPHH